MSAGTDRVVVIGAGVGGLAAAARLGQLGFQVEVLEARNSAGGFASSFEAAGLHFDAGPYVLLDRPGLDWAFSSLQADLSELIELRRIDQVYEVRTRDSCVKIHADLEETARGLDRSWPGVGKRYERFVESAWAAHRRLAPSLFVSRPGLRELLRGRSIGAAGYLWRSLGSILASQQFPRPVRESLAIWTQIAGQRADEAPGPMAFVPALIHKVGAFYPVGGFGVIPAALERLAREAGVSVRFGAAVRRIRNRNGSIEGVETSDGERIETRTVLTDSNAVGVYAQLLDHPPRRYSDRLTRLPMQSPGTCAYLSVQKASSPPYLEFRAPGNGRPFRLLVLPSAVDRGVERNGRFPARLIAPIRHSSAEALGAAGQEEYLDQALSEDWWSERVGLWREVARLTPKTWGSQYFLYRESMNPVMTKRSMLAGRVAHRSPYLKGLYCAGSSTHPGQWVSFCAISGILAADCAAEDLRKC